jgi:hypothetical protein
MIIFREAIAPPRAWPQDNKEIRPATQDTSTNTIRSRFLKSTGFAGNLRNNARKNDLEFREAAK